MAPAPRRLRPEDRQRLGLPPDLVERWEVRAYRPHPDGKGSLDLGDMLKTPVAIRPGDRLKVKATFREPVHAAVVVIRTDGSARPFGGPANAAAGRPAAERSILPGENGFIPLADPGPTVLALLAARPLAATPVAAAGAGALVGALEPTPDPSTAGLTQFLVRTFASDAPQTGLAGKTWVFDGQVIVPIPMTPMIEEAAPQSFAAIASALQVAPGLDGGRAVLFEVAAPK